MLAPLEEQIIMAPERDAEYPGGNAALGQAQPFRSQLEVAELIDTNSHLQNNANHYRLSRPAMNLPLKPPNQNLPSSSGHPRPRLDSSQLLQGAQTIEIEHAGQCYLLRVTRENKLILTK